MMLRRVAVLMVTLCTALLSACSLEPTDLPLPGTRVSGDAHALAIEFTTVLNLPARSKVLLNGTRIGVLREVSLRANPRGQVAVATVDLEADVPIPVGTRAELTQATLLGDFYIALTPPPTAARGLLRDGATIPVADTSVSPQVEELLGGIAALANGGTVTTLQRVINNANKAFPADEGQRDVGIEILRALVARSATESASIRQLIDSVAEISRTLDANAQKLGFSFDFGPRRVSGAVSAFLGLSNVLNALGPNVVPIGDLVIPRYATLNGLISVVNPLVATAVRLDARAPSDLARIDRLLADRVIPLLRSPSIDLVDVTSADGRPSADPQANTRTVAGVLRMIGAVR